MSDPLSKQNRHIKPAPHISVVTPVLNGEAYLESTIKSVISQHNADIEYIIIDGGSSDRTLEIIKDYNEHIDYWLSEPDSGVYEGVNKGLNLSTGNIMCWINAGDTYFPWTFEAVIKAMQQSDVEWVTGIPSYHNEVTVPRLWSMTIYPRRLVRAGYCHGKAFGFIPQESTFWRRTLWEKAGGKVDATLKFAGDHELWTRFAEHAHLRTLALPLGSFLCHSGQLSENTSAYYNEIYHRRGYFFRLGSALLKLSHARGLYSMFKRRTTLAV